MALHSWLGPHLAVQGAPGCKRAAGCLFMFSSIAVTACPADVAQSTAQAAAACMRPGAHCSRWRALLWMVCAAIRCRTAECAAAGDTHGSSSIHALTRPDCCIVHTAHWGHKMHCLLFRPAAAVVFFGQRKMEESVKWMGAFWTSIAGKRFVEALRWRQGRVRVCSALPTVVAFQLLCLASARPQLQKPALEHVWQQQQPGIDTPRCANVVRQFFHCAPDH
mgnify:CR=1 FL=1